MTPEKIHQLNLRMAREVMGWQEVRLIGPRTVWLRDDVQHDRYIGVAEDYSGESLWSPSTDMNHAMEIQTKMRERGFSFELSDYTKDGNYEAVFLIATEEGYLITDNSPQLAICLAAAAAIDALANPPPKPKK